MDINAVPTNRRINDYVPGKQYWADKVCSACNKVGHGHMWRGCPKHPEHRANFKGTKTYAASVAADHHSPMTGPSTAAAAAMYAAATTSTTGVAATAATTAATAAAADRMDRMEKNMEDMMAMLQAMQGNN